jgi:Protein of unknown function (DUF2786)
MTITEAKKNALIQQLQKLREMTLANGCSENEAKVAAEKAQSLMDVYGVTMEEITSATIQDDLCEQLRVDPDPSRKTVHEVWHCIGGLGEYTQTKSWRTGKIIVFFGMTADVQIAKYLLGVFQTAMDSEFTRYWKKARADSSSHGRTARYGFMLGMADRLNVRLIELIEARRHKHELAPSESRALVVVKEQVVKAAFARLGFKVRRVSPCIDNLDGSSYIAGWSAGDNVAISAGGLNGRNSMALK